MTDELPFDYPDAEGPALTGAKGLPKRCAKHKAGDWVTTSQRVFLMASGFGPPKMEGDGALVTWCPRCRAVRSDVKAKMGKSVVARSKREERKLAALYQGKRTGHHGGPDDVQTDLTNVQSKAGSTWWSRRYWDELVKLPRTGGRVPLLVLSNGEPGHLIRRMVVLDERDFRALFGDKMLDRP